MQEDEQPRLYTDEKLTYEQISKMPREQRLKVIGNMTTKEQSDYFGAIFLRNLNNPDNHDKSN
jgi:hypothetical protein